MVSHESEVICFLDQLNGSPEIIQILKKKEKRTIKSYKQQEKNLIMKGKLR